MGRLGGRGWGERAWLCWLAIIEGPRVVLPSLAGKAVDALLNFETVTLCGNSELETRQYDTTLTQYQVRAARCVR